MVSSLALLVSDPAQLGSLHCRGDLKDKKKYIHHFKFFILLLDQVVSGSVETLSRYLPNNEGSQASVPGLGALWCRISTWICRCYAGEAAASFQGAFQEGCGGNSVRRLLTMWPSFDRFLTLKRLNHTWNWMIALIKLLLRRRTLFCGLLDSF
jgi:hypothetical protein